MLRSRRTLGLDPNLRPDSDMLLGLPTGVFLIETMDEVVFELGSIFTIWFT